MLPVPPARDSEDQRLRSSRRGVSTHYTHRGEVGSSFLPRGWPEPGERIMLPVPMRARRSCLSVPGSSEKMLAKARILPADEVIIDLEDSVTPQVKDSARTGVAAAIRVGGWHARTLTVRINAPSTRWCYRDVIELVETPVTRSPASSCPRSSVRRISPSSTPSSRMVEENVGRREPIGLQALIETAAGLRHVHDIAQASPRIEALIVGYADLAASLGRPPQPSPRRSLAMGTRDRAGRRARRWPAGDRRTVAGHPRPAGLRGCGGACGARSATTVSGRCTRRKSSR